MLVRSLREAVLLLICMALTAVFAPAQRDEELAPAGPAATYAAPGGILRDLAYGSDPAQRIDVYLPAHAHNAPVLFMVHGGAWFFGDKRSAGVVDNKAAYWLPRDTSLSRSTTAWFPRPIRSPRRRTWPPPWPLHSRGPLPGVGIPRVLC